MKRLLLSTLMVMAYLQAIALNVTVQPGGDIQAAIDRVTAAGVKGKVILVEGTYSCDATLVLKNYITIVGAGRDKTTLRFATGTFTALQNKGEYSVLKDAGVESLRMEGETKGAERYAVSITALGDTKHRNITFRDVEITNLGMSHFKRCTSLVIENCYYNKNTQKENVDNLLRLRIPRHWG